MNNTIKQIIKTYIKIKKFKKGKKKNRAEIKYSNKKLRPQKGSGKARISTKKSPLFIGGGRAFPPKANKKYKKINKKMLYYTITKLITIKKIKKDIKYIKVKENNFKKVIKNIIKIKTNKKIIIIYKNIYKDFLKKIQNNKNIILLKENIISPINFNNNYKIFIINNSLKWIKKI